LGDDLDNSLMNPSQLWANGEIVDNIPEYLALDPTKATHSIHIPNTDLTIPLHLKGIESIGDMYIGRTNQ
jgi:hypothetical protein